MNNYKEMYEKTKKELEDLKLKELSSKERIVREIAKILGDNPLERKSWTNAQTKEVNYYEAFTNFYDKLFSRLSKDDLVFLLKKLKELKNDILPHPKGWSVLKKNGTNIR